MAQADLDRPGRHMIEEDLGAVCISPGPSVPHEHADASLPCLAHFAR